MRMSIKSYKRITLPFSFSLPSSEVQVTILFNFSQSQNRKVKNHDFSNLHFLEHLYQNLYLSIIVCYWSLTFLYEILFISLSSCLLGYFSLIRIINILNILICQYFHIPLSFRIVDGIFPQLKVICSNRYLLLYFLCVLSSLQNAHFHFYSGASFPLLQFSKYYV